MEGWSCERGSVDGGVCEVRGNVYFRNTLLISPKARLLIDELRTTMRTKLFFLIALCIAYYEASCAYYMKSDTIVSPFPCLEVAGDVPCGEPPPVVDSFEEYRAIPGSHYACPSLNPNNPNQFVCFRYDWERDEVFTHIVIYDMLTGDQQVLFSNYGIDKGHLSWGKKDWIAHTSSQGNIRIFKKDGCGSLMLQRISGLSPSYGDGTEWSLDGNYLYHPSHYWVPAKAMLSDTAGNIFSSAPITKKPSWNSENEILNASNHKIEILDLSDNTKYDVADLRNRNVSGGVFSIKWLPDNRYAIFSAELGLYRVDTPNGEIVQLKESCFGKKYRFLSISNQGDYIICEKAMSKKIERGATQFRSEIWKMDINGCNEVRVLPKE